MLDEGVDITCCYRRISMNLIQFARTDSSILRDLRPLSLHQLPFSTFPCSDSLRPSAEGLASPSSDSSYTKSTLLWRLPAFPPPHPLPSPTANSSSPLEMMSIICLRPAPERSESLNIYQHIKAEYFLSIIVHCSRPAPRGPMRRFACRDTRRIPPAYRLVLTLQS